MGGLDVSNVVSEDKHYSSFICTICHNLVSLDAVVTSRCSHPFCRDCLGQWAAVCAAEGNACSCPKCSQNLTAAPDVDSMKLHGDSLYEIACRPLQEAQPLAFQVLTLVQVACHHQETEAEAESPSGSAASEPWIGDYGKMPACSSCPSSRRPAAPERTTSGQQEQRRKQSEADDVLLNGTARNNGDNNEAVAAKQVGGNNNNNDSNKENLLSSLNTLMKATTTKPDDDTTSCEIFPPDTTTTRKDEQQQKHFLSAVADNYSGEDDAAEEKDDEQEVVSLNHLSPRKQKTRWNGVNNNSISRDPPNSIAKSPSSGPTITTLTTPNSVTKMIPKLPATSPNKQQTTITTTSENPAATDPQQQATATATSKRAKSKRKSPAVANNFELSDGSTELENSYCHAIDWNMTSMNISYDEGAPAPLKTVTEEDDNNSQPPDLQSKEEGNDKNFKLEFEPESPDSEAEARKIRQIMGKAIKLKKQANAKFNKGEFANARALYTEGIAVMNGMKSSTEEECELISNMHSNRAVTYFREKHFEACIADCDKALSHDPLYDKSWIRKWRALLALGEFDLACRVLENAVLIVPNAKRVQEELTKTRSEKELLQSAKELLEKKEFRKARDLLRPHLRATDNICLLFIAARADTGIGNTESALEKVNKALRLNPVHKEGQEIRGYTLFLAGEMEKGAHLLQEAYCRDKDDKNLKQLLSRCQKTHSVFAKGRSCVKRGRYLDAAEHFTIVLKLSGEVPVKSHLYGMLRTERAEAWLLSGQFSEAQKDCKEVIVAQPENATAWVVRAEILVATDKAEQAIKELEQIRKTWGGDNPTISEGYRRVDFELRVLKADDELMDFVEELEAGNVSVLEGAESEYTFERRASTSSRTSVLRRKSKIKRRNSNDNSEKTSSSRNKKTGRRAAPRSFSSRQKHNDQSRSRSKRK